MRVVGLLILLTWGIPAIPQDGRMDVKRPFVITDAIALPLSSAQIFNEALKQWRYTFGQEPGANLVMQDTATGTIQGTARINFRSSGLGSREETMGVITYEVAIQAENGQCRVRTSHFQHTGNRNSIGGGIDLGLLYAGDRPQEKIPGISMGTAQRLHADMCRRAQVHIGEVIKTFAARMRRAAGQKQ